MGIERRLLPKFARTDGEGEREYTRPGFLRGSPENGNTRSGRRVYLLAFALLAALLVGSRSWPAGSEPPDWIVALTIRYPDSKTGKPVTFKADSKGPPRSIQVPAGAPVTLVFEAANMGGNPGSDGVSLDVWYDWPKRTLPGDGDEADVVCIPNSPTDCLTLTRTLKADLSYRGKTGRGIYRVAAWVDRFDTVSEFDETNNFLGPMTIRVLTTLPTQRKPLTPQPRLRMPQPAPSGTSTQESSGT